MEQKEICDDLPSRCYFTEQHPKRKVHDILMNENFTSCCNVELGILCVRQAWCPR